MRESYGEGVASHTGPESCAVAREGSAPLPSSRDPLERHDPQVPSSSTSTEGRCERYAGTLARVDRA